MKHTITASCGPREAGAPEWAPWIPVVHADAARRWMGARGEEVEAVVFIPEGATNPDREAWMRRLSLEEVRLADSRGQALEDASVGRHFAARSILVGQITHSLPENLGLGSSADSATVFCPTFFTPENNFPHAKLLRQTYGDDSIRYWMLNQKIEADWAISMAGFVPMYDRELANDFGNLFSRLWGFIYSRCGGRVPAPDSFEWADADLGAEVEHARSLAAADDGTWNPQTRIASASRVIHAANRRLDSGSPWTLRAHKDDERISAILFTTARAAAAAAGLLWPVMPETCDKALAMLGVRVEALDEAARLLGETLEPGAALGPRHLLFPRLGD